MGVSCGDRRWGLQNRMRDGGARHPPPQTSSRNAHPSFQTSPLVASVLSLYASTFMLTLGNGVEVATNVCFSLLLRFSRFTSQGHVTSAGAQYLPHSRQKQKSHRDRRNQSPRGGQHHDQGRKQSASRGQDTDKTGGEGRANRGGC